MSEIRIVLPGSVKSKKNSKQVSSRGRGRRAVVLPSKAYAQWEGEARRAAAMQLYEINLPMHPVLKTEHLHIEAHCYCKGPLPDLSGALESIGDCLEGICYENDRQIVSWDGSRVHHDKDNPRTEVIVRW